MPQAAKSDQFLYADDSWLVFQRKHVIDIEKHINRDSTNICEWFVDIRVSIHFGEDNTRFIFFVSKCKIKKVINYINYINYKTIQIKQRSKVTCLGCI